MKNSRKSAFLVLLLALLVAFVLFHHVPRLDRPIAAATQSKPAASPDTKPKSSPPPLWTINYGQEFWRKPAPIQNVAGAPPSLNVHEIIDRVSHAFRTKPNEVPTATARDYVATTEGATLHFTPETPADESTSEPDFQITATSIKIGDREILTQNPTTAPTPPSTHYSGNTAQTILQTEADATLVQHLEARAEGVELSWILQSRPAAKGPLRIEANLQGLNYSGATARGFHFADDSGVARARIGHATLIDSSGNRAELPTDIIDNRLVVQVPADLLATAAYPIAIDPLISPEFGMDRPVSATIGGENAKVASDGADYLVVWHDWRNNHDIDIYAARVSREGWILDPNGIGIRVGRAGQDKFAVASNGSNYLIVWTEYGQSIMGARLATDGTLLDPDAFFVCLSPLFPSNLSVAGNGDDYLVLWRDNRDHRNDIYGGVVRASDGQISDILGTKLVEDTAPPSPAAIAPHLGAFVAIWRASGRTEGAFYRIQDGAIAKIADIQLPTAGGPATEPAVASGPGGILVAWEENETSSPGRTDIYGQLLSPTGQPNSAKFPICTAPYNQTHPAVAANSSNFIVTWQDNRRGAGGETTNDIYFARVANNADVTPANGQLLTTAPASDVDRQNQTLPVIASNGDLSLIVWTEISRDLMESVRSARVTPEGTVLDPRGLPITVATINPQQASAIAANSEGFLVAWVDQRNGADIYGARFTRDGHILDPAGIAISTARASQNSLSLTSNGADYFAIWCDSRDYDQINGFDIYGARISAAGYVIDPNGIPINAGPGYDFYPKAASDGTNYLAAWQRIENRETHIYTRVIRSNGDPLPSASLQIKGSFLSQVFPNVASNGREYIVAWTDGGENVADAYGQRFDHSGAPIAPPFVINSGPKRQIAPLIASNGDGYFVTWLDGNYDASNFDPQTMFGTRLSATGQVLDDPPILIQPESHYYIQRALASDGHDYMVVWQIMDQPIKAVRINPDGQRIGDTSFTIAVTSTGLNEPALAASGGTWLVTYTSFDNIGGFPRIRGKTIQFTLPEPWLDADIGATPTPGTAGYKDGVFTIQGSRDPSSGIEGLHYIYQTLDGDGQIIARLTSLVTPNLTGRAGIMLRDSIVAGSAHAFIGFNGNSQTVFTRRKNFGDTRIHTSDGSSVPIWLKLIRAGELILAYRSEDGITWQRFDTTTIDFGQKILVGLAITSNDPKLATAQFDHVSIWRFQAPAPVDPPTAPTLTIQPDITLHLTGDPGTILQLETSSDLIDWTLFQNITNTTGAINLNNPSTETSRFYRLAPAD